MCLFIYIFESQRKEKKALNGKMMVLPFKDFELEIGVIICIIFSNPGSFSKSDMGSKAEC